MAIRYDHLMALDFPAREFRYGERDTLLYALGVGMGQDMPTDLPFVFEQGLQVLPTQATVMAWEDTWQEATGMDLTKIVHGEQRVTLHRPLTVAGHVRAKLRIVDAFDKGPGRGAVLLARTDIHDAVDAAPVATLLSTIFARGDGGFGGPTGRGPAPHHVPERAPDGEVALRTRPEQALIYRLSGDRNPLHVDPAFARRAGFERPILHGLCSYGVAAVSVVRGACGMRADRITHFEARFTAPVFPGETLSTAYWVDGDTVSFRTRVVERGVVALDHGKAVLTASTT
ncbi:MaoC family dehydratase [Hydrogenophaga sp.]|uniref:MaoC family dehydratase n=1 Tax=Hydrogenophaga sp. TaxID=1904254 RepID=UPI002616EE2D|nr:MaoC family dehydratase [Hydrogenophaga sp.]MCW5653325.1 MaoC family dehydratase N-terminal domain-containing protein [Hydrogenophaga sp.]